MSRFTLAALMTRALNEGAINKAEFDSLQKRILARPN